MDMFFDLKKKKNIAYFNEICKCKFLDEKSF